MNLTIQGMKKIKILCLYSELAEYFLACLKCLHKLYPVEIHLVRWPVNEEAPFDFEIPHEILHYERNELNDKDLISLACNLKPDLIFTSGWMDKGYIQVCKKFRGLIPVIAGMDNQWKGTIKQKIACVISPITIQKYFSHIMVAGDPQKIYAGKLGFSEEKILEGYYCADFDLFNKFYHSNKENKNKKYPHRFLYVGRYIEKKGVMDLWQAFTDLSIEERGEWELWCAGTGKLEKIKMQHDKIRHLGFLQPDELGEIIRETGVFVLPSHSEPWGVVVHEFTAAGFPVICSDKVGAATKFLSFDENGYSYKSGDIQDLKQQLIRIISLSDEQLVQMSEKSVELASALTPQKWSRKLMSVID